MGFFPSSIDLMGKALAAAGLRHQVLANNIANADTPGFTGAKVNFEDALRQARGFGGDAQLAGVRTDLRHIPIGPTALEDVAPTVVADTAGPMRPDGNNVDIEAQMALLSANQLWYEALVRSESDAFSRLQTVISGGAR